MLDNIMLITTVTVFSINRSRRNSTLSSINRLLNKSPNFINIAILNATMSQN